MISTYPLFQFSTIFYGLPPDLPVPSLVGFQTTFGRTLESVIASGAFSGFWISLDPEQHNCEEKSSDFGGQTQSEVVLAGIAPAATISSASIAPCGGGVKLDTTTNRQPNQDPVQQHLNSAVTHAPSPFHPHLESEVVLNTAVAVSSGTGVVHGGGDIAGLGALDTTLALPGFIEMGGPTSDSGGDGLAAADWVSITHAMLDASEGLDPPSG